MEEVFEYSVQEIGPQRNILILECNTLKKNKEFSDCYKTLGVIRIVKSGEIS
jgi:hypothetical protein